MSEAAAMVVFVGRQALLSATPIVLAGVGELVAERTGVINLGIEGVMICGAFGAYAGVVMSGGAGAAVPAGIAGGMVMAGIFGVATIFGRADQIVAGTALNLLAFGASTTGWRMLQHVVVERGTPGMYEPVRVAGLAGIPVVGEIFFTQYGLFYVAAVLAVGVWALLRWTRAGLLVTALGDAPDAANAMGYRVRAWRMAAVLFAGACGGAAGAYLSTMRNHTFQWNMTAGQGFLVLSLVIFGRWTLGGMVAGALLFGLVDAGQAALAAVPGATGKVPHQVFGMLPYVATLVALAAMSKGRGGPRYLGAAWPGR